MKERKRKREKRKKLVSCLRNKCQSTCIYNMERNTTRNRVWVRVSPCHSLCTKITHSHSFTNKLGLFSFFFFLSFLLLFCNKPIQSNSKAVGLVVFDPCHALQHGRVNSKAMDTFALGPLRINVHHNKIIIIMLCFNILIIN